MAIQTLDNKIIYPGNGVDVTFVVPFKFYDETHLQVYVDTTLQTLTTDYTVTPQTNVPNGTVGGDVTFVSPPANGTQVTILRTIPLEQTTDLVDLSVFPADTVEAGLDLLTMIAQQLTEQISRCIILPPTSLTSGLVLSADPNDPANFGKFLRLTSASTITLAGVGDDSALPLAAVGDLLVGGAGNLFENFPVGVDGRVLTADSAEPTGVRWADLPTASDDIPKSLIDAKGDLIAGAADNNPQRLPVGTNGQVLTADNAQTLGVKWAAVPPAPAELQGRCRLEQNDVNSIRLVPHNGNTVVIKKGGIFQPVTIPSGGVIINNSSLAAGTTLNVFLFDNAGVLNLELTGAFGHSRDPNTGYEIKTGDDTRLYVGKVRTNPSNQFADTAQQRFIRSYFNPVPVRLFHTFSGTKSTASGSFIELDTVARLEFVNNPDDIVLFHGGGYISNSSASFTFVGMGLDGNSPAGTIGVCAEDNNFPNHGNGAGLAGLIKPVEGYHFLTPLMATSGGTTGNWSTLGQSTAHTIEATLLAS